MQSQRVAESERVANEKTIEVEQLKHKERVSLSWFLNLACLTFNWIFEYN